MVSDAMEWKRGGDTMGSKLQMILTMSLFGTVSLFVKHIPLSSAEISLYRGLIALLVLMGCLLLRHSLGRFSTVKGCWRLLLLSGVALAFDWIFFLEAFHYASVAVATLCYYFAPVMVVAGSAFFFREKLTAKQFLCFVGATAGVVLIIGVSGGHGVAGIRGILCSLTAAFFYAVVVLLNKAAPQTDGVARTVVQLAGAVLVLFAYVGLTGGYHLGSLGAFAWGNLLTLGAFHTGLLYVIYFSAISRLRGQESAILSYFDPLVAVLVSILILGESVTGLQLVGGGAILLFTLLNELTLKKPAGLAERL